MACSCSKNNLCFWELCGPRYLGTYMSINQSINKFFIYCSLEKSVTRDSRSSVKSSMLSCIRSCCATTLRMCEKSWACHTVRDHPTQRWSEANSRKLFLRASIRFMIWSQNFDWNSSMYIQCKNNLSLAMWIRGTPLCNLLSRKLAILDAQNAGNWQK